VARDFGNLYRMVDPGIAIKKHPSQNSTHWGIDAALELHQRYDIDPAQIASVRIETPVRPYTDWGAPQTGLEGKFSFQYTVAAALLGGRIGLAVLAATLESGAAVPLAAKLPTRVRTPWIHTENFLDLVHRGYRMKLLRHYLCDRL
jgi:2-methylcitrate dehydratase PrpD